MAITVSITPMMRPMITIMVVFLEYVVCVVLNEGITRIIMPMIYPLGPITAVMVPLLQVFLCFSFISLSVCMCVIHIYIHIYVYDMLI